MEEEVDAGYESLPCLDRILSNVDCIGVEKRSKPSKHQVYVLVVSWSDGVKYPVYRRYISFFDLKTCLKEEFKDRPDFQELELPALKHFERGWLFANKETAMERRKRYINKFCQVIQLPVDMVRSGTVVSFYETWESDYEAESSQRRVSVTSISPLPAPNGSQRNGRRGSQPQVIARYQTRDIPDLEEARKRRPRSTSLVQGPAMEGLLNVRTSHSHAQSLPRGASLDSTDPGILEQQYRVTSDYERRRSGEVNLKEGQIVEVLERNMTGWWFVHIDVTSGKPQQGWAPGAFLCPVLPAFSRSEESLCETTGGEDALVGDYETICGYSAQKEDEVSYTRGQHVEVTAPAEDGWWKVRLPDSQEGYTPAINLQRNEDKPDIKASSTFQKRSLRGRGPPPRSRPKGDTSRTPQEAANQLPVYAQIRRTGPQDVTSQEVVDDVDWASSGGVTIAGEDSALNYTDIVFKIPEDPTRLEERERLKNRDRVEYAEINPRPLPKNKMIDSQAKEPRGQQEKSGDSHIYVNINASASHASPQTNSEQMPTTPVGAGGRHDSASPQMPKGGVHGNDPAFSESGPVDSKSGQPHPVPKPRRLNKPQPPPNYENSPVFPSRGRPEVPRPPAPDPPPSGDNPPAESLRYPVNYENHAVAFINDLLRSSTPSSTTSAGSNPTSAGSTSTSGGCAVAPPSGTSPGTSPLVRGRCLKMAGVMNVVPIEQWMVQLPPHPARPAPALPPDVAMWWARADAPESNMVEAVADYEAETPAALTFRKGDLGVLVKRDTNGWLGVKVNERVGWVPTQYWSAHQPKPHTPKRKIKNIKQAEALHENQAWFLGKISRLQAEDLLLQQGQQRDFLIRESTNRVGDLTLSVRYQDRVRHFPIQMTPQGKYDIGKAHFADLIQVVNYYRQNPLFFDEQADNAPVSLGKPINQPKDH